MAAMRRRACLLALVTAAVVRVSGQQPQIQDIDCVAVTRRTFNSDLPARFAAWSQESRKQCLNQLLREVSAPQRTSEADTAAQGIADLAWHGLVTDVAVFPPLIECLRIRDNFSGMICNRALEALTRHKYGHAMFQGYMGVAAQTTESRNQVIGDWRQLLKQLEGGRPIFDADLRRMCSDARRALGGLADTLSARLSRLNSGPSYLAGLKSAESIPNSDHRILVSFSLGSAGKISGETLRVDDDSSYPSNWGPTPELQRIRFMLFRPGIPNPSPIAQVDSKYDTAVQRFPATSADYVEVFEKLDLEFRFELVTSRADLRSAAVETARDALRGLRQANAAYRR